jgi:hypothetical protein
MSATDIHHEYFDLASRHLSPNPSLLVFAPLAKLTRSKSGLYPNDGAPRGDRPALLQMVQSATCRKGIPQGFKDYQSGAAT